MNTLYIENIDNQYNKLSDSAIPLYKLLFYIENIDFKMHYRSVRKTPSPPTEHNEKT